MLGILDWLGPPDLRIVSEAVVDDLNLFILFVRVV
jgi:hypothetical protein